MLLILSPTDRHSIPNFRVTNHAAVNTLRRIPRCACAIIRLGHTLPEAEPLTLRIHTFFIFPDADTPCPRQLDQPCPRSGAGEATSKPCSPANASLTLLPAYLCFVKVAFPRSFNVHLSGCQRGRASLHRCGGQSHFFWSCLFIFFLIDFSKFFIYDAYFSLACYLQ